MTDPPFRRFVDAASIRRIGEGLLARTLPKALWTHEAHLAACVWLLTERPDIDVDAEIATIISGYNASLGGINDDTQGYHDTITRAFVHGVRLFLASETDAGVTLDARVNALLDTPMGRRDWPLRFYTSDRLMSVAARRGYVEPDLAEFPPVISGA